jgi:hypothetical protein
MNWGREFAGLCPPSRASTFKQAAITGIKADRSFAKGQAPLDSHPFGSTGFQHPITLLRPHEGALAKGQPPLAITLIK